MEFPTINFSALAPELIVIVTAFLVMFLELFVENKRWLGYLSLLGLAMAGIVSVVMLNNAAAPAFQTMAVSDGYSLVLNLVFIITAALSILISLSYLQERALQYGEYYALLLFSTGGMMM